MKLDLTPFLKTEQLGRTIEQHASLDSTNVRARELAKAGAATGTCVVADAQTAGRGRLGRNWHSPLGAGLYVSFVLRPAIAPKDAALLTLTAGVAVADAVIALTGADVGLKWPNDLFAGPSTGPLARRKLGGILVDLASDSTRIDHAVVGIGLNLREVERPPEVALVATSIEALTGVAPDRAELLAAVAGALEAALGVLETSGPAPIVARFTERAVGLGERIVVDSSPAPAQGVYEGIEPDGALRLRTTEGPRRIYAGDLHLDRGDRRG